MSNNNWMVSRPCKNSDLDSRPESKPCLQPKPESKEDDCCCKKDMRKALKLLFHPLIKGAVEFNEFAFIGKNFLVGTAIEDDDDPDDNDNIFEPNATLACIDPCHSDFIKITGSAVRYPIPAATIGTAPQFIMDINRVSLCNLDAIVFQYDPTATAFEENLKELLDNKYPYPCHCHYRKDEECCCGEGIFKDIILNPYCSGDNLINFTAGWLAATEASILGRIGNILVLANTSFYPAEPVSRIYFVCIESIGFYEAQ